MKINKINKGFTLAEILITLTVIGIVAAISIPALNQSVNEKAWKTQKKALHVRLTNAIASMPKIKGYGEYTETKDPNTNEITVKDTLAESFLIEGLSKVYKMNNICSVNNLENCGLPKKIITQEPKTVTFPQKWSDIVGQSWTYSAAAFQTTNGESIAVFYNPNCLPVGENTVEYGAMDRICVNFIYDLNGAKLPNQMGRDIGVITALYKDDLTVVAPDVFAQRLGGGDFEKSQTVCRDKNADLRLPTVEEATAIISYKYLINTNGWFYSGGRWTSSIPVGNSENAYYWSDYISSDIKTRNMDSSICVYK